jgi:hypothetical protein
VRAVNRFPEEEGNSFTWMYYFVISRIFFIICWELEEIRYQRAVAAMAVSVQVALLRGTPVCHSNHYRSRLDRLLD